MLDLRGSVVRRPPPYPPTALNTYHTESIEQLDVTLIVLRRMRQSQTKQASDTI
jgi:hypothetical protein